MVYRIDHSNDVKGSSNAAASWLMSYYISIQTSQFNLCKCVRIYSHYLVYYMGTQKYQFLSLLYADLFCLQFSIGTYVGTSFMETKLAFDVTSD